MVFAELRQNIQDCLAYNFIEASGRLQERIFNLTREELLEVITEIGTIPEDIGHDSTEEKLYTKASDILFAKALEEMNLEVQVLTQRADCADIVAQSHYFNYSLVGDAKAFRLSRTAKNAKDFKVTSMVHWKGDCDFSVLACPYFQYPKSNSQIYKDALNGNVSLFSWEYLYIMLKLGIKETPDFSLNDVWNQSEIISCNTSVQDSKRNFLNTQNENIFRNILGLEADDFYEFFGEIKDKLIARGYQEISYYETEIQRVKQLNREEAIKELLITMKLDSKVSTIQQFIEQLKK